MSLFYTNGLSRMRVALVVQACEFRIRGDVQMIENSNCGGYASSNEC